MNTGLSRKYFFSSRKKLIRNCTWLSISVDHFDLKAMYDGLPGPRSASLKWYFVTLEDSPSTCDGHYSLLQKTSWSVIIKVTVGGRKTRQSKPCGFRWLKVHYNVWNHTFKYEKIELLVCIYEIPRELVFIYGISGHSGWSSPFGSLHVLHVLWSSIDVSIKD